MSELRNLLQAVHDEHGDLTPRLVVDTARDPRHPLHTRFEWDDTVAAERYRLDQAGQLLRVTFRPDPTQPTHLRAFVAVKGEDSHQSSYVPTEKAFADPFTRTLVLRAMEREWRTFKKRWSDHTQFADMIRREIEGEAS